MNKHFKNSSDFHGAECSNQIIKFTNLTQTKREEWTSAPIIAELITNRGIKHLQSLEEYGDYESITPFVDLLGKTNPKRLSKILFEHEENRNDESRKGWEFSCQYCGHGIIYLFYIVNHIKKLTMEVGSDCVHHFDNADPMNDLINNYRKEILENDYKNWNPRTYKFIWNNHKNRRGGLNQNYWEFQKKLRETREKELVLPVLVEIYRSAKKLGLPISDEVKKIIKRRLSKKPKTDGQVSI